MAGASGYGGLRVVEWMGHPQRRRERGALENGGSAGQDAARVAALLDRSRSRVWADRIGAIPAMTRLAQTPEVLARLTEMLTDEDEAIVMAAAEALLVGPADAGAEAVLTTATFSDSDISQAIADMVPEAARYPYVFDRLIRVANDERLDIEVRMTASRWVRELSRQRYPLSPSFRAYLGRDGPKCTLTTRFDSGSVDHPCGTQRGVGTPWSRRDHRGRRCARLRGSVDQARVGRPGDGEDA